MSHFDMMFLLAITGFIFLPVVGYLHGRADASEGWWEATLANAQERETWRVERCVATVEPFEFEDGGGI